MAAGPAAAARLDTTEAADVKEGAAQIHLVAVVEGADLEATVDQRLGGIAERLLHEVRGGRHVAAEVLCLDDRPCRAEATARAGRACRPDGTHRPFWPWGAFRSLRSSDSRSTPGAGGSSGSSRPSWPNGAGRSGSPRRSRGAGGPWPTHRTRNTGRARGPGDPSAPVGPVAPCGPGDPLVMKPFTHAASRGISCGLQPFGRKRTWWLRTL